MPALRDTEFAKREWALYCRNGGLLELHQLTTLYGIPLDRQVPAAVGLDDLHSQWTDNNTRPLTKAEAEDLTMRAV